MRNKTDRWCCGCLRWRPVKEYYENKRKYEGREELCCYCIHVAPYDLKKRYRNLIELAAKRNKPVHITEDFYIKIMTPTPPCHYCGGPLHTGPSRGYRLDRMDNDKGYLPSNVVPCCMHCNAAKSYYWTYDEFISIMHFTKKQWSSTQRNRYKPRSKRNSTK